MPQDAILGTSTLLGNGLFAIREQPTQDPVLGNFTTAVLPRDSIWEK